MQLRQRRERRRNFFWLVLGVAGLACAYALIAIVVRGFGAQLLPLAVVLALWAAPLASRFIAVFDPDF